MPTALVALLALQTPVSVFDSSLQAHARLLNMNATVQISGRTPGYNVKTTFRVRANGSDVLLRMIEEVRTGQDRSDRSYLLKGNSLIGFDHIAREQLKRPVTGQDRTSKLQSVLGDVEESVGILLSPTRAKQFFTNLKSAPGWQTRKSGSNLIVSRGDAKNGTMSLTFGAADKLLRALSMKRDGSNLQWQITYAKPASVALAIPAGTRTVSAFTVAETPPKFASKAAETVYRRMQSGLAGLTSATVGIKNNGRRTRVIFNSSKVKQDGPGGAWLYDGKTLAVMNPRTGKFFRGACSRSKVVNTVAATGVEIEPFARDILLRRQPLRGLFDSNTDVSIAGSMRTGGIASTILRGIAPTRRLSVAVRTDLNLPTSASTDNLDLMGKVVSSNLREFDYARVNKPQLDTDLFLPVPNGTKVLPLPK